ncbi:hypothetical protein GCM10023165_12030 [Variovorax defluvii]|uniref:Uncharacterized protein n=1 Tax=Variovorax defluvii TaxID=913761 RepID=A0ABP8H7Q9_9BURK
MTSTAAVNEGSVAEVAFGSLIDLAMLHTGAVTAEVCEACSTINLGSVRLCKGCSHKLPAYYSENVETQDMLPGKPGPSAMLQGWARVRDFTAFWLVVHSLAGLAVLVPVLP